MAATPDPNAFGPQLDGHFDFTLYFEHAVLSIIPSSLFLALAPCRLVWLFRQPCLVRTGWLLLTKLALAVLLFALELTMVVLWANPSTPKNAATLPATILEVCCTAVAALLLYTKHKRSIRPSKLLSLYLFVTVLVGLAHARSLFLLPPQDFSSIARIFTATLVARAALLLLEEFPKTPFMIRDSGSTSVESVSGPLNRSVFWWLNPLFVTGARRLLQVHDLGSIDSKFDSNELLSALRHVWTRCDKSTKHCLLSSTLIAYKVGYLTPVIPRLCLAGFSFSQPFLIKRVIEYVSQPVDSQLTDTSAGLIAAAFLIYSGLAISRCIYNHATYQLSTTLRGGLVSLIFGRLMELEVTIASEEGSVTLMSTDVDSIASGVNDLHEIWASILELGVAIYLLYLEIGAACFVVAIPAVVCSLVTDKATNGIGPAKMAWNQGVQERVSRTSSMLSQIKGIMMMGLSDYLSSIIHKMRVSELDLSKKFRMFIVRIILIANISDQMTQMAVVTAAVFWTRADGFSISQAFTSLGIVALVSTPLANLIGSYPMFVSSVACFGRIQEFLLAGERVDDRVKSISQARAHGEMSSDAISSLKESSYPTFRSHAVELTSQDPREVPENVGSVVFESATLSVNENTEAILRDITLCFNSSDYTVITGPVGCGKSTILKAILGEIRVTKGSVRVAQDERSIAYCSQSTWLQNLSVKANIVGKDPFDPKWYTTVVCACALEEDIRRFPKGEDTLIGSGGITLSGGQKQRIALARALYARRSIVLLDDIFSALDAATSKTVFTRILGPGGLLRQSKTTVILATHRLHFLSSADKIVVLDSARECHQYDSFSEMQSENPAMLAPEYQEDALDIHDEQPEEENEAPNLTPQLNPEIEEENSTQRQAGDFSLYVFYLRSMGTALSCSFALLAVGYIGLGTMPSVWLRIWTEHGTDGPDRGRYFGAYLSFCVGTVIFSALAVWLFFVMVIPRSATHLHWQLLDSVMHAPLWFFTTVDSGVTLNRFSQDMTLVDQTLPVAFFEVTLDTLVILAAAALIASGAQYFTVVIPFCVVPLYFLQKYYLRTSRQMRHLDLESKSPLYTHFTETSAGLATIRAFGWQREFVETQLHLLDISQKPYYLMFCIQRWLGVVLDLFVVGIATILIALAVSMTGTTSGGAIGLAMVNLIGLNTSLSRVINAWTNLETSLGAIARLRDFTRDTPREDNATAQPPLRLLQDGPFSGHVEINEVNATYSDPTKRVLQDISLSIKPGQKVGICGRTGSGKTSLLLAILRMIDVRSGSICVDDMNLSAYARQSIRRQITTLPQDVVILPGTVRANLDPYGIFDGEANEGELVAALDRVSLWDGVIGTRGGLDTDLEGLGLSHGQMQLFGLARAFLHKDRTCLLLLDEATSSVDRETDLRLQTMIREDFAACTLVAVAHRLETVQHYDAVVVMERGMVVEVGDPRRLMEDHDSAFYRLMAS